MIPNLILLLLCVKQPHSRSHTGGTRGAPQGWALLCSTRTRASSSSLTGTMLWVEAGQGKSLCSLPPVAGWDLLHICLDTTSGAWSDRAHPTSALPQHSPRNYSWALAKVCKAQSISLIPGRVTLAHHHRSAYSSYLLHIYSFRSCPKHKPSYELLSCHFSQTSCKQ